MIGDSYSYEGNVAVTHQFGQAVLDNLASSICLLANELFRDADLVVEL